MISCCLGMLMANSAAYETASHSTVFVSVGLSFVGLGASLALMLRPKTAILCIWSMTIFSLAWLIESTTHLLGVGEHVEVSVLEYGIWVAVGMFGLGFVLGLLGVLAYQKNEHKYERGLVVGVFATLLNLWVVGGIVKALRSDRTAVLGRGLVIPVMSAGGPVDDEALAAAAVALSEREQEEAAMRMTLLLGRMAADLARSLAGDKAAVWELQLKESKSASEESGPSKLLTKIHAGAQHRLNLAQPPGWMSVSLVAADSNDPSKAAAANDEAFEKQILSLMPQRRLRSTRTHFGGFELIRSSIHASIKGFAGALVFDRWVAVGGGHTLEVWACTPDESDVFFDATRDFVAGMLRQLQSAGLSGNKYSPAVLNQRETAMRLEWAGGWDDALTAWKKAAVHTPADPEVLLGVVRCSWKLGRTAEAVTWLDSLPSPPEEPVSVRLGKGRLRAATGDAEARKALVELLGQGVADDDTLAALLLSLVAEKDRATAAEVLADFGSRHAASLVAWWDDYLAPAAAPPVATQSAPAADPAPAMSPVEADMDKASPPTPAGTRSKKPPRTPAGRRG